MKNIKQLKTTFLGIFFILAASFYWYSYPLESDRMVLGAAYLVGVLLLIAPDKLFEILINKFK